MSSDEESEYERIRQKNLKEKQALLASILSNSEYESVIKSMSEAAQENKRRTQIKKISAGSGGSKKKDTLFRFTGAIPRERRSSQRIRNKNPEFTYTDLPDENEFRKAPKRLTSLEDDDNLEDVVFEPKKKRVKRTDSQRASAPVRVLPVDQVTEEMLANIIRRGNKVYSAEKGTSCHQCRQKTMDTKTVCRSGYCVGVQGQFCGICILNRYGEDAAEALKDPDWKCFVCRGICNCSFCRAKAGKRPTGILTPLAKEQGFKSVKDYLAYLGGYGDYVDVSKDPEALTGFPESDQHFAVLKNGQKVELGVKKIENNSDEVSRDPEALNGFPEDDRNFAVLKNGQRVRLGFGKIDIDSDEVSSDPDELKGFPEDDKNSAVLKNGQKVRLGLQKIEVNPDAVHRDPEALSGFPENDKDTAALKNGQKIKLGFGSLREMSAEP